MKHRIDSRSWKHVGLVGLALGFGLSAAHIHAASTVVSETMDFSNNLGSPTVVTPALVVGTTVIRGSVDGHTFGTDHDYLRVTLASGARLAGIRLQVTNFSTSLPSSGFFDVLPTEAGNSGSVTVSGNLTEDVAFVIGTPTNIVLRVVAPFAVQMGGVTSYNYEVQLVVAPIEVVAGTTIQPAVEITFPSEVGQPYQLQCTSDLASDAWMDVGGRIQGQGGMMSAFDTTRHADQRFYRVVKP